LLRAGAGELADVQDAKGGGCAGRRQCARRVPILTFHPPLAAPLLRTLACRRLHAAAARCVAAPAVPCVGHAGAVASARPRCACRRGSYVIFVPRFAARTRRRSRAPCGLAGVLCRVCGAAQADAAALSGHGRRPGRVRTAGDGRERAARAARRVVALLGGARARAGDSQGATVRGARGGGGAPDGGARRHWRGQAGASARAAACASFVVCAHTPARSRSRCT
jgi:hypothetical protein